MNQKRVNLVGFLMLMFCFGMAMFYVGMFHESVVVQLYTFNVYALGMFTVAGLGLMKAKVKKIKKK